MLQKATRHAREIRAGVDWANRHVTVQVVGLVSFVITIYAALRLVGIVTASDWLTLGVGVIGVVGLVLAISNRRLDRTLRRRDRFITEHRAMVSEGRDLIARLRECEPDAPLSDLSLRIGVQTWRDRLEAEIAAAGLETWDLRWGDPDDPEATARALADALEDFVPWINGMASNAELERLGRMGHA